MFFVTFFVIAGCSCHLSFPFPSFPKKSLSSVFFLLSHSHSSGRRFEDCNWNPGRGRGDLVRDQSRDWKLTPICKWLPLASLSFSLFLLAKISKGKWGNHFIILYFPLSWPLLRHFFFSSFAFFFLFLKLLFLFFFLFFFLCLFLENVDKRGRVNSD